MARRGFIRLEISIEEHVIQDLIFMKQVALRMAGTRASGAHLQYEMRLRGMANALVRKLLVLEKLEGRESHRGRFAEVEEIKKAIGILKKIDSGAIGNLLDTLDELIADMRRLENLELRLG